MDVKAVFDTHILVDYLSGISKARRELGRYRNGAVSLVTWMEILVGAENEAEDRRLRAFLSRFELLPITTPVAEHAVALRRGHRIRLPDAIIWATAETGDRLLVTRNTRDSPKNDPGIRVPYTV